MLGNKLSLKRPCFSRRQYHDLCRWCHRLFAWILSIHSESVLFRMLFWKKTTVVQSKNHIVTYRVSHEHSVSFCLVFFISIVQSYSFIHSFSNIAQHYACLSTSLKLWNVNQHPLSHLHFYWQHSQLLDQLHFIHSDWGLWGTSGKICLECLLLFYTFFNDRILGRYKLYIFCNYFSDLVFKIKFNSG